MDLRSFYNAVGGDLEQTLSRLPSEKMIFKFVLKFPDDPSHAQLTQALESGDIPTAFRAAHTLKGTSSTLGFGELTAAASALTEQLRNATALPQQSFVAAVNDAYRLTIENIQALQC